MLLLTPNGHLTHCTIVVLGKTKVGKSLLIKSLIAGSLPAGHPKLPLSAANVEENAYCPTIEQNYSVPYVWQSSVDLHGRRDGTQSDKRDRDGLLSSLYRSSGNSFDSENKRLSFIGSGNKARLSVSFSIAESDGTVEEPSNDELTAKSNAHRSNSTVTLTQESKATILNIVEVGGAPQFQSLLPSCAAIGDAFLLVYDVTNLSSFTELWSLYRSICEVKGRRPPCVIVGSKIDCITKLNPRQVPIDLRNQFSTALNVPIHETTAKAPTSVTHIFNSLLDLVQMDLVSGTSPLPVTIATSSRTIDFKKLLRTPSLLSNSSASRVNTISSSIGSNTATAIASTSSSQSNSQSQKSQQHIKSPSTTDVPAEYTQKPSSKILQMRDQAWSAWKEYRVVETQRSMSQIPPPPRHRPPMDRRRRSQILSVLGEISGFDQDKIRQSLASIVEAEEKLLARTTLHVIPEEPTELDAGYDEESFVAKDDILTSNAGNLSVPQKPPLIREDSAIEIARMDSVTQEEEAQERQPNASETTRRVNSSPDPLSLRAPSPFRSRSPFKRFSDQSEFNRGSTISAFLARTRKASSSSKLSQSQPSSSPLRYASSEDDTQDRAVWPVSFWKSKSSPSPDIPSPSTSDNEQDLPKSKKKSRFSSFSIRSRASDVEDKKPPSSAHEHLDKLLELIGEYVTEQEVPGETNDTTSDLLTSSTGQSSMDVQHYYQRHSSSTISDRMSTESKPLPPIPSRSSPVKQPDTQTTTYRKLERTQSVTVKRLAIAKKIEQNIGRLNTNDASGVPMSVSVATTRTTRTRSTAIEERKRFPITRMDQRVTSVPLDAESIKRQNLELLKSLVDELSDDDVREIWGS